MAGSKEIKRRIKSVKNTAKITRAMEMVAAAKMRKAVSQVLAIRPYAHSAWSVLTNLAKAFKEYKHGLLAVREVKSILLIAVASNRGLCGSFNSQVAKKLKEEIDNPEKLKINRIGDKKLESKIPNDELRIDIITVGKKAEQMVKRIKKPARNASPLNKTQESGKSSDSINKSTIHEKQSDAGGEIIATFHNLDYVPKVEDIRPLVKIILEEYLNKKYDKVVIVYTDYISTITQQVKLRQLLPLSKVDIEKQIAEMDVMAQEYGIKEPIVEYKVEPSPQEVLEYILPRLIEMQVYHAILESNASKESAQMVAMKNATEAALEMADDLTFAYNQIRQMKITQEIAEISAGRAALEN
ncbi:MAG: F0F1 ATP synthase subunit gamma [Candidatus Moranbacteria bacterium]|nr:F0F1 ATP synthase subunit gamma [Candidatus Moranbacteria bacterium]